MRVLRGVLPFCALALAIYLAAVSMPLRKISIWIAVVYLQYFVLGAGVYLCGVAIARRGLIGVLDTLK